MSDEHEDEALRAQLEVTKEFLEAGHGRALRYGTPKEARAYYDAIDLVECALEQNWDLERAKHHGKGDLAEDLIEESREAREEGHKAATRFEEELENRRQKYDRPSLLDRLLPGD